MICHAGAGHPHDAIERGPWGELCSTCWTRLLVADDVMGRSARNWEARRWWTTFLMQWRFIGRCAAAAIVEHENNPERLV